MDNLRFGQFVAELRRERGMTQKELAAKLNVTDKAVSKWETAKGFPDIKLMEPLAEALGVTLVDLIRCQRQEFEHLTAAEADKVVSQAMAQSQRITARRYLRLLRWLLIAIAVVAAYTPLLNLAGLLTVWCLTNGLSPGADVGIIGGADDPTAILISTASSGMFTWLTPLLMLVICVVCIVLVFKVRKVEKDLM